jgi:hypothetical protein
MSKVVLSINPSFLLKGVDPHKVAEDYFSGKFAGLTWERPTTEKKINAGPIVMIPINENNPESAKLVFSEKNSYKRVVVFSNQEQYDKYNKGDITKHKCDNCRIKFDHNTDCIPLYKENIYCPDPYDKNAIIKVTAYWGTGTYCDLICTFSAYKQYNQVPIRFRDVSYNNSELYIREIFLLRHPGETLRSLDRRLLKKFGGSLDYNEWKRDAHEYTRIPGLYILPVKVPYEKIEK